MDAPYKIIPKKETPKFPTPERRSDQYDQPIGPKKETTAERIARAARSAGTTASSAVKQFANNPTVKKTVQVARERADVFQHNISLEPRQQATRQQPQQPAKQPLQHKYKPPKQPRPTGQVRAVQPPPQRLAAQEDPFGVRGGGHDDPLGRGFVPLNKRSGVPRADDNPFGLRR